MEQKLIRLQNKTWFSAAPVRSWDDDIAKLTAEGWSVVQIFSVREMFATNVFALVQRR